MNKQSHKQPELRIPWGLAERMQTLLHPQPFHERFAFAAARPLKAGHAQTQATLLEQLVVVADDDYERTSSAGLALTAEASERMNQWAVQLAANGWIAVHLHSHPPGASHFSATDDAAESQLAAWLSEQGVAQFWSLVWPQDGAPRARLWHQGVELPGRVVLGLAPVEPALGSMAPALERQRAFGPALRQVADELSIGVVGVGGLGMLAVEQLARAGFRRFVLVDPDRIETTNLNRLPGVTQRDVGRPKVQVGKRLIRQIASALGRRAEVVAFPRDVYLSGAAQRGLQRCDLILALTDNELSRTMALQLALDAGRDYLQAGTDITLADDGAIAGLRAEVTGAETGRYCPICSGRLSPAQAAVEARVYAGGEIAAHARAAGYLPDVAAPAVMGLNAVAAGMLVTEIQRRAAGIGVRDLLQLDLQTGEFRAVERVATGQACDVCGAEPPATRTDVARDREAGATPECDQQSAQSAVNTTSPHPVARVKEQSSMNRRKQSQKPTPRSRGHNALLRDVRFRGGGGAHADRRREQRQGRKRQKGRLQDDDQ
ncbi:MAG: ThiF family adenylyltransferase [Thiocapsa sp.]|uniref:ThiF family adenylyltransferase n=1 Tax=Thiocapsa sp. TaxID=2024551 RepID=UPI001BCCE2E6|nr:ThiF family adenylyltransferase [Thiocapsa sp.]QVL49486.1 MAG: ThiF family adenylyltransferase [Thiocapsa sp.]